MKVSDLVEKLQEFQSKYGDVEVLVGNAYIEVPISAVVGTVGQIVIEGDEDV